MDVSIKIKNIFWQFWKKKPKNKQNKKQLERIKFCASQNLTKLEKQTRKTANNLHVFDATKAMPILDVYVSSWKVSNRSKPLLLGNFDLDLKSEFPPKMSGDKKFIFRFPAVINLRDVNGGDPHERQDVLSFNQCLINLMYGQYNFFFSTFAIFLKYK